MPKPANLRSPGFDNDAFSPAPAAVKPQALSRPFSYGQLRETAGF
jgi:hypothetical protein